MQDAGEENGPDAPPPPPQPKARAAPASEGELREGRMNEGEQGGRGPGEGTPSVRHHSLSPLGSHPLYIPLHVGCGAGGREGRTRGGGDRRRGAGKNQEMPTFSGPLGGCLTLLPQPRRRPQRSPPPGRPARRQRGAGVAFPSPPPAPPPASERRAQRRSNLPSGPRSPRPALPPRPADPFKPPGRAAAAPGGNAGRGWGRGDEAGRAAAAGRPVR